MNIVRSTRTWTSLALAACVLAPVAARGAVELYDWGFNLDNTTYCSEGPCDYDVWTTQNITGPSDLPAAVDWSGFDFATGMGTLVITVSGSGHHQVLVHLDHDIDYLVNDSYNENGVAVGTPAGGQSWEIDEPGFGSAQNGSRGLPYYGDIFLNFKASTLDNQAFYDGIDDQTLTPPDEVSMDLGFAFDLAGGETATVTITAGPSAPPAGFFLLQTDADPNSTDRVYLSGTLTISGTPVDADQDGYPATTDCNDNDPTIHPGAAEVCDGVDQDCNGLVDDGLLVTYWQDADLDGFGDPAVTGEACDGPPAGFVDPANGVDCDDSDATVYPGAVDDTVDGIDQNCDGVDGPAQSGQFLFFPDVSSVGDQRCSLGVTNLQALPSDVLIRGYDVAGNDVTEPAFVDPVVVSPGERYNNSAQAICGTGVDCAVHLNASLPASAKASTYVKYADGTYGSFEIYEGVEATSLSYFPMVDDTAPWTSILKVVNPAATPAHLEVRLYDDGGNAAGFLAVTVPPHGRSDLSPRAIFGGPFAGSLTLASDIPVAGTMVIANGEDAKAEYGNLEPGTRLYFPKSYDINGWENMLVVQNTGDVQATVTVRYFENDGTELFRVTDGLADSHLLAPRQRYTVRPSALTGTQFRGWMLVEADQPVTALLSYRNGTVGATVYTPATPKNSLVFDKVYDGMQGWTNSLTIHNFDQAASATVDVEVFDNSGALQAMVQQIIPPQSKWNPNPSRDLLNGSPIVGTIRMTSDLPVNGLMTYYWKDSGGIVQAISIYEAGSP